MAYIKENGEIYEVTTTKVLVDLEAMKEQLVEVRAQEEPSDEELILEGRTSHPYYFIDASDLEAKIAEIEKAIK